MKKFALNSLFLKKGNVHYLVTVWCGSGNQGIPTEPIIVVVTLLSVKKIEMVAEVEVIAQPWTVYWS